MKLGACAAIFVAMLAAGACGSEENGDGGSATGGAGGAGAGGSAGSGGSGPGMVDCDLLCDALLAAQCPGGIQSHPECLGACAGLLPLTDCPEREPWLECIGPTPRFECDSRGDQVPRGCATEHAAMQPCFNRLMPPDGG